MKHKKYNCIINMPIKKNRSYKMFNFEIKKGRKRVKDKIVYKKKGNEWKKGYQYGKYWSNYIDLTLNISGLNI